VKRTGRHNHSSEYCPCSKLGFSTSLYLKKYSLVDRSIFSNPTMIKENRTAKGGWSMASRYFFHMANGDQIICDDNGIELSSHSDALIYCVYLLNKLKCKALTPGMKGHVWHCEVYEGSGQKVHVISLDDLEHLLPSKPKRPREQPIQPYAHKFYEGSIRGLRLPLRAWTALQKENITTVDQLQAVAGRLERLPGLGSRTAKVVRAELARVASVEEP
jgi:hypothetical protein